LIILTELGDEYRSLVYTAMNTYLPQDRNFLDYVRND
jgi:hypothetical protein